MHEKAEWLPGTIAETASDIDREFEARLAD